MFIVLLFCSFCPALVSRRTLGLSLEKARCELSQPHPTPARPLGQTPSKGLFGPLSPPVPQTFDPSRIWVNLISVPGPLVQFSTVFVKHLILTLSSAHPWYPLSNASVGIFLLSSPFLLKSTIATTLLVLGYCGCLCWIFLNRFASLNLISFTSHILTMTCV